MEAKHLKSTEELFLQQGRLVLDMMVMNANSYHDHVAAVHNAARIVAKKSMKTAVEEAKEFYEPEDGIYDIAVSADGTWRRRDYSSVYGVVAALSTITGKVLDIEIMSKECRECMVWRDKDKNERV